MANIKLPDDKKEAFINELLEAKNTPYIFESIIDRIYYEGWSDGYESEDHNHRNMYKGPENKKISK